MEILSYIINILAMIGWLTNISYRKYAMFIFTISTLLSIIYFYYVWQPPFFYRSVVYLIIDLVTLYNIILKKGELI